MIRLLARLVRARRGVAAVEFAVLAPAMFALIMGAIELAHIAVLRSTLEGAVGEAARVAAVRLDLTEDEREAAMVALIRQRMSEYPIAPGGQLTIETKVYHAFGSAMNEPYEDTNQNGVYDGPLNGTPGEPFDDRNLNGVRDVAIQSEGKLGGVGDVVGYTASFPARLYFSLLEVPFGAVGGITVAASTMVRNEPTTQGDGL